VHNFFLVECCEIVTDSNFQTRSQRGNSTDKVADETGHGLLSTQYRRAPPMIQKFLNCGGEYIEKFV
jgi:hypothetical protein